MQRTLNMIRCHHYKPYKVTFCAYHDGELLKYYDWITLFAKSSEDAKLIAEHTYLTYPEFTDMEISSIKEIETEE